MRKICLLLLIVMMLFASAQAEQMEPFDPVAQWFNTQAQALNPAGIEAREQRDIGAVLTLPDGAKAQSLRLTVEGDLALPASGCVNLANLEGVDEKKLSGSSLVEATGTLSGTEHLEAWTVMVDGVAQNPSWCVFAEGSCVKVKRFGGLNIIIR